MYKIKGKTAQTVIFFILILVGGYFIYADKAEEEIGTADTFTIETTLIEEKIKRHFVAVTHLTSDINNVSGKDITNVKILKKDEILLKKSLSLESYSTLENINNFKLSKEEVGFLRVDDLVPRFKVLTYEGKSIWKDEDYSLFFETKKENNEEEYNLDEVVTLSSVGDLMLARTVYVKSNQLGFLSAFSKVADRLKSADITFGNLETSVSDLAGPSTQGMSFVAPTASLEGVKSAGFDVLNLANNHSTNFGLKVYDDLLNNLNKNELTYVGGGLNSTEAKSYKIIERKGKSFAFMGANSIVGDNSATKNSSGNWKFSLYPWGGYNQSEIDEMKSIIKEANEEADFSVIMIHWGMEYTHVPSSEMKKVAHELVDAGVDLIVGTHPHWTQGVEIYNDDFIPYSLGNFVFDQEWSQKTKEGLILETTFYRDRLVDNDLVPVLISNYHQPRIVEGEKAGERIMNDVWEASEKIDSEF